MTARKKSTSSVWQRLRALPKPFMVAIWAIVFGMIGLQLLSLSGATSFQAVATHPQALAQTTASGKIIRSLGLFNGKVYAGFGDYDANTGPVALNPFNPTTLSFAATPEFSADTEAIYRFRNINGRVYIPSIDPKMGDDYTMGEVINGKTVWSGHRPAGMTHIYDIVTMNGTDLWMIGSKSNNTDSMDHGQVWYSADGGASWVLSLDAKPAVAGNNVLRFTFAAPVNGTLYVQGYEFKAGATSMNGTISYSWAFNGSRWSKVAASGIAASSNATVFKGKVIMTSDESAGSLQTFDGKTTTTLLSSAINFTVSSDGYVYAITRSADGNQVIRSSDLLTWQNVAPAPSNSSSILADGQYIYLGTYDSKIYRADLNDTSKDSTPPTATMVSPTSGTNITAPVLLQADATDASGISKVEFYANGTLLGSTSSLDPHSTSPDRHYVLYWDGQSVPVGSSVAITAVAYDLYSNSTTSAPVQATVNVPKIVDTTAPIVTITFPSATTKLKKTTRINANASDNGKLASLVVSYDGTVIDTKQATASQTYLSSSITSPVLTRGSHTISVTATDISGNQTTKVLTIKK